MLVRPIIKYYCGRGILQTLDVPPPAQRVEDFYRYWCDQIWSYWWIFHSLKMFLSRVMITTENSRTGYEEGQFPNRVVLRRDTNTKLLIFVFSFAKRTDPIVGSVGRVLMAFIFVVISYIEVSIESSDEVTNAIITSSNWRQDKILISMIRSDP